MENPQRIGHWVVLVVGLSFIRNSTPLKCPSEKVPTAIRLRKNIEGEVWSWSLNNREGLSDVEVLRNFAERVCARGPNMSGWSI